MQWRGVVISSTLNHGKIAVNLRQISEPQTRYTFPVIVLILMFRSQSMWRRRHWTSYPAMPDSVSRRREENCSQSAHEHVHNDSESTDRGISWRSTLQSFLAAHITMNKQNIKVVYHWRLRSMTALMRRTAQMTLRYKHIPTIERLKTK